VNERKNFDCLLPKTRILLEELIETAPFLEKYIFVGGSALALHICHRKSEDLDFFTYQDGVFDRGEIRRYIGRFAQREIINESDEQIDMLVNGVKVTFFNAKWKFLHPKEVKTFNLASLESIAAMKVNVLFLRAKYRDYYDLYFLSKEMDLRRIFEVSSGIVDGLTYRLFCISLLYIDDIIDDDIKHLQPLEQLTKQQIRAFFEKEILRPKEK
jgi:predicted nucleotidyltransferase component of viral defense system